MGLSTCPPDLTPVDGLTPATPPPPTNPSPCEQVSRKQGRTHLARASVTESPSVAAAVGRSQGTRAENHPGGSSCRLHERRAQGRGVNPIPRKLGAPWEEAN